MNIGIFGGTFNPIHIGHLRPVEEVREYFNLDRVLFILAKNPPHKTNANIIDAKIRFKILELALENNEFFIPSDIEIKREGKSYTYDTLIELKEQKNNNYFLIIGKDSFYDIKSWYRWKDILSIMDIIVLNRKLSKKEYNEEYYLNSLCYKKIDKFEYTNDFKRKIYLFNNSIIEVSSSKIRENFKLNISNKYLIPDKALDFILKERLYRE